MEVGRPVEEKNDLVWEGEAPASKVEEEGGSVGDGFGDNMEGVADCSAESTLCGLSLVWWGSSQGELLGSRSL